MHSSLFALACVVAAGVAPWLLGAAPTEPAFRLQLQIDGAVHECVDGEELAIVVAGKPVRAKVAVRPERRFEAAGLRFDFPRGMTWEHDADIARWMLEGDDCVVRVHRFASGDPADYARNVLGQMLQSLDKDSAPASACKLTLGGQERPGLRGRARVAGTAFEVTAVGLLAAGTPVLLLIQDTLDDDGKPRRESLRMRELLQQTFGFTGEK